MEYSLLSGDCLMMPGFWSFLLLDRFKQVLVLRYWFDLAYSMHWIRSGSVDTNCTTFLLQSFILFSTKPCSSLYVRNPLWLQKENILIFLICYAWLDEVLKNHLLKVLRTIILQVSYLVDDLVANAIANSFATLEEIDARNMHRYRSYQPNVPFWHD